MQRKQIAAILSDYDGTLCSTTSVRGGIGLVDTIPQELDSNMFQEIIPFLLKKKW